MMNLRDFRNLYRNSDSPTDTSIRKSTLRRELREVRLAFEVEIDYDKAIALATPFLSSPDSELRRQAKRHIAISHFYKTDYQGAARIFAELAEGSTCAGDWISVATSRTLSGDVARGEEAFETALKIQELAPKGEQPSIQFMQYWYAVALRDQKEYHRAFVQIQALRSAYEQLSVTDSTYLHNRRLPSLFDTMSVTVDVLKGIGESIEPTEWIREFASHLDSDGSRYLKSIADRFEQDD